MSEKPNQAIAKEMNERHLLASQEWRMADLWQLRAKGSSVVAAERLHDAIDDYNPASYRSDRWPLPRHRKLQKTHSLWFAASPLSRYGQMVPDNWQDAMRRVGWLLINQQTPQELVEGEGSNRVEWPAPSVVAEAFKGVARFARWLDTQPHIDRFEEVTDSAFSDWIRSMRGKGRSLRASASALELLHALAPGLPAQDRLPKPTWVHDGEDILGQIGRTDQEPLAPAVALPLLRWAILLTGDFAPDLLDVLNSYREQREQANRKHSLEHLQVAKEYLRQLRSIPTNERGNRDTQYLAVASGLPVQALHSGQAALRLAGLEIPKGDPSRGLPFPTEVQVLGTLTEEGQPWWTPTWNDVSVSNRKGGRPLIETVLFGAGAVVLGLQAGGPRGEEVRALKRGSLQYADTEKGVRRWTINGRRFKGTNGSDGEPFTYPCSRHAAHAVETLEAIPGMDSEYLFTTGERPFTNQQLANAVSAFVDFANHILGPLNLSEEWSIPEANDGSITPTRFRKTLGPLIHARPGGRIALASTLGHASVLFSGNTYGLKDEWVLDGRTGAMVADAIETVADSGGVSGNGAARAVKAVARFRGTIRTDKDLTRLGNQDDDVYVNEEGAVACMFDHRIAPCQNDVVQDQSTMPDFTNCIGDRCPNCFFTDHHARKHEKLAAAGEALASMGPAPEGARLWAKAQTRKSRAKRHWETRTPIEPMDLPTPTIRPAKNEVKPRQRKTQS